MEAKKILSDLREISLLIVEDGEDIIKIMDRTFRLVVRDITLAYNGKEGYELYKKVKPDIILLDLRMPEMDGNKLIDKIRETDKTTPIFVVTAYKEDLQHKDKIYALIEKPIDFITLLNQIDECILEHKYVKTINK